MREHPEGYKLHHSAEIATGSTLLHKAAMSGNTEEVKRLLKEKVHMVNVRDSNGWTPLHVSAWKLGLVDTVHHIY